MTKTSKRLETTVEYKDDRVAIVKTELETDGHYANPVYKQVIVWVEGKTRRTTIFDTEDEFNVEQTTDSFCDSLDEAIEDAKDVQEDAMRELYSDYMGGKK